MQDMFSPVRVQAISFGNVRQVGNVDTIGLPEEGAFVEFRRRQQGQEGKDLVEKCLGSLYLKLLYRKIVGKKADSFSGEVFFGTVGANAVVFEQKVGTKSMALKLEGKIKQFSKEKKEWLIDNPGNLENILNKPA